MLALSQAEERTREEDGYGTRASQGNNSVRATPLEVVRRKRLPLGSESGAAPVLQLIRMHLHG